MRVCVCVCVCVYGMRSCVLASMIVRARFAHMRVATRSLLESYFEREQMGAYKGDICRFAALYMHGGFYFDVDMLARLDVRTLVQPKATLLTVEAARQLGDTPSFFQSLLVRSMSMKNRTECLLRAICTLS
jgi:hypothetical protein